MNISLRIWVKNVNKQLQELSVWKTLENSCCYARGTNLFVFSISYENQSTSCFIRIYGSNMFVMKFFQYSWQALLGSTNRLWFYKIFLSCFLFFRYNSLTLREACKVFVAEHGTELRQVLCANNSQEHTLYTAYHAIWMRFAEQFIRNIFSGIGWRLTNLYLIFYFHVFWLVGFSFSPRDWTITGTWTFNSRRNARGRDR